MPSRRDALRSIAAVAIVPALQAQHQHSEPLVSVAQPQAPKNLAAADFDLLTKLVDVIIPRTDTPGAADAGVQFNIDRAITKRPALGPEIQHGLEHLREGGFSTADEAGRIAQLKTMEAGADPFFKQIKTLTLDGYYSSKEGLVQELGYHGNTYLTEFKGCTHPEHGATSNAN